MSLSESRQFRWWDLPADADHSSSWSIPDAGLRSRPGGTLVHAVTFLENTDGKGLAVVVLSPLTLGFSYDQLCVHAVLAARRKRVALGRRIAFVACVLNYGRLDVPQTGAVRQRLAGLGVGFT